MSEQALTTESRPELPQIIERYLAGESIQAIAKDCAVHRDTIYRWMLGGLGDKDYHEMVTHCLVKRVADADALLYDETYDIARAREIARFSRMDLERRRPALYGPKQEVKTDTKITVIIARDGNESHPLAVQPIDIPVMTQPLKGRVLLEVDEKEAKPGLPAEEDPPAYHRLADGLQGNPTRTE